jgi:hypothetical protein
LSCVYCDTEVPRLLFPPERVQYCNQKCKSRHTQTSLPKNIDSKISQSWHKMDQPLAKEPMLLWKTLFQVRQVNFLNQNPNLPRQKFETPLIEAIKRAEEAVHQPPPGSLNGDNNKLMKNPDSKVLNKLTFTLS